MFIFDESWTKTDPKLLVAAGYTGGFVYCSYDRTGKNGTPEYIKVCHDAGLHMGLVWESFGQAAQGGAGVGGTEARDFIAQARALGAIGGTLWMAVEDPTKEPPANWPGPEAYSAAAYPMIHAAGFMLGEYGSEALINDLHTKGLTDRKWFVGGWSQDTNADLIQQSNNPGASNFAGAVDCNYAPADNWGWTEFGISTPSVPNPPAPPVPASSGLTVDGVFGPQTIAVMQRVLGVTPDGVYGVNTRKALQAHLHVAVDGIVGPFTIRALQSKVGSQVDGVWGHNTTYRLQEAFNAGRF